MRDNSEELLPPFFNSLLKKVGGDIGCVWLLYLDTRVAGVEPQFGDAGLMTPAFSIAKDYLGDSGYAKAGSNTKLQSSRRGYQPWLFEPSWSVA